MIFFPRTHQCGINWLACRPTVIMSKAQKNTFTGVCASLQVSVVAPMRLLFVATALIACACSAQRAPQAPPAPARAPDRFIYVSASDVPSVCYHDLGGVSFT